MTFRRDNACRMRRRIVILGLAGLLAVNALLLIVEPGVALPRSLGSYFFGPRLVRADVVIRDGGIREFRLDRGCCAGRPGRRCSCGKPTAPSSPCRSRPTPRSR